MTQCPTTLPATARTADERFHAFDGLRATMLFLGILMHGVQCYTVLNVYMWPLKDAARSEFFDFLINWVHLFRMPVFFVMAGFFFALLRAKRGLRGALVNRRDRILIPFVLAWLVLAPVLLFTIGYLGNGAAADGLHMLRDPASYWKFGTLHLWFLEYLLLLCPLMLVLDWGIRRCLGPAARDFLSAHFRKALNSPARAPIFALLAGAPQVLMGGWLTTSPSFIPNLQVLATYLMFFAFGWCLYAHHEHLDSLKRYGTWELLAGCGVALLGHGVLTKIAPAALWPYAGTLGTWLLVFASVSLFLRFLDRPFARVRYLADSSYWLYLVHVPVLIWIQYLLAPAALPALTKGLITLSAGVVLLLASYELVVRKTWIGALLNGKTKSSPRLGSLVRATV